MAQAGHSGRAGLMAVLREWPRDAGGRVVIALSVYVFLYTLWTVFHWGGEAHVDLINGIAFQPVMLIGAALAWRASRHPALDRRTSLAWAVIAGSFVAYWVGDAFWFYYESIAKQSPFPSWADAAYLSFYPLLLLGLLLFPVNPKSGWETLKITLDGAIVALAATLVIWFALLSPMAAEGEGGIVTQALSLAYPVGDLVLIYGIVALLFRRPRASSAGALSIFLPGLVLFVLADFLFGYLSLQGEYASGTPIDAVWVVGELVMVAAAQCQHSCAIRNERLEPDGVRESVPLSIAPYIALLAVFVLAAYAHLSHPSGGGISTDVGVLILGVGLITGLASARQFAALRENELLLVKTRTLAEEARHQAFHDPLTGLPNRVQLLDRLHEAIPQAERENRSLAVLLLDVDDFRTINDSLGHGIGDEVLIQLGSRISSVVRSGDITARLGGDEFAVLLEDADEVAAARTAECILEALRAPLNIQGCDVFAYASLGIALHQPGVGGPIELLRNADVAMYAAKGRRKGPYTYEIFDEEMHLAAVSRLEMKADLQRALDQNEFVLQYQPIVNLATGKCHGFEALLRWDHPQRGMLQPAQFLSLAEETGIIVPIGSWVIEEAGRTVRSWQETYRGMDTLDVSVNVSARQLQESSLPLDVGRALLQSGLRADSLILEITESALMQNTDGNIRKLQHLKSLGVRVAIDDFGMGYSSFGYLQEFSVDILKIDKRFVDRVQRTAKDAAVMRTIMEAGHALGMSIIAEGVEELGQAQRLRDLGCDYAQGYHFARPMNADEAERLLKAAVGRRAGARKAVRTVF